VLVVGLALGCLSPAVAFAQGSAAQEPAEAPSSVPFEGAEPEEVFLQANQAYEEGSFLAAIEKYQSLIDEGLPSGPIYYNLGNSYLRAGALREAIAAYRHSLALAPRDGDVAANLAFARGSAKDAITPPGPSPVMQTLFFWHYLMSRSELQWAIGALNVLFWLALIVRLYRRDSELALWTARALVFPLGALAASWIVHMASPSRVAVVQPEEISVYAGISEDAVVRFKLHEGTEAAVVDQQGAWVRITLSDGKDGWVQAEDVAVVVL